MNPGDNARVVSTFATLTTGGDSCWGGVGSMGGVTSITRTIWHVSTPTQAAGEVIVRGVIHQVGTIHPFIQISRQIPRGG